MICLCMEHRHQLIALHMGFEGSKGLKYLAEQQLLVKAHLAVALL